VATLSSAASSAVYDFAYSPIVGRVTQHPFNIAIGYITPKDTVASRQQDIQADRDRKLERPMQQVLHAAWQEAVFGVIVEGGYCLQQKPSLRPNHRFSTESQM
jgi:hypothetical protein